MKKNLAIIIVLVLVLIVGGFIYFRVTGRELPFGLGGGEGSEGGEGTSQGFLGKLSDALSVGTAMKCTVKEGNGDVIFYLKGGKLRGEVVTNGDKVQYIFRDNCMYYWSDAEDQGMKMCWESSEVPDWEENLASAAEQFDCQPQTISDSMFSLPSGVDFLDMSDYTEQYLPTE